MSPPAAESLRKLCRRLTLVWVGRLVSFGANFQSLTAHGVIRILEFEKPSKSSLHTRRHNSSVRENNRIEFLTGFSFLKGDQPMWDGLGFELTLHKPQ
jgi:hypothetical protein